MVKYMAAITIMILLIGCSGGIQRQNCLSERSAGQFIRWGESYKHIDTLTGYGLDSDGVLFSFVQCLKNNEYPKKELANITCKELRSVFSKINKAILKIQALNVPGDTSHWVEFNSPKDNVYIRFVWNPAYDTQNNKEFIEIYDILSAFPAALKK